MSRGLGRVQRFALDYAAASFAEDLAADSAPLYEPVALPELAQAWETYRRSEEAGLQPEWPAPGRAWRNWIAAEGDTAVRRSSYEAMRRALKGLGARGLLHVDYGFQEVAFATMMDGYLFEGLQTRRFLVAWGPGNR